MNNYLKMCSFSGLIGGIVLFAYGEMGMWAAPWMFAGFFSICIAYWAVLGYLYKKE